VCGFPLRKAHEVRQRQQVRQEIWGSAVEGPAVSLPVLPQNRHPERSASQIDRVTQHLWRGVEGPRRCLITHAARSFSTTEARPQELLRYAKRACMAAENVDLGAGYSEMLASSWLFGQS
jgi:hypothetical protein